MTVTAVDREVLPPESRDFYGGGVRAWREGGPPFLIGGAYALAHYTGIVRHTRDFDVFVRPEDAQATLDVLASMGWRTEMTFSHWLGKAFHGEDYCDVIFSSGNGVARVDDLWFEHAVEGEVLGQPMLLIPAEEMIWSKGYVCERERFDGADINHLIRSRGPQLDWRRLVDRFGTHWRVLLSHLILYGFVFPGEQDKIPAWVM